METSERIILISSLIIYLGIGAYIAKLMHDIKKDLQKSFFNKPSETKIVKHPATIKYEENDEK